jgi:hypothetical protein
MKAMDNKQKPRSFAHAFAVAAPLIVAGMMALTLDVAFYIASGGLFLFSIVLLPLWLLAYLSSLAALHALLAIVPPVVIFLLVAAASALRRVVFGGRRGRPLASFPGFLAS